MSNRTLHYWFLAPARASAARRQYWPGHPAARSSAARLSRSRHVWPHDAVRSRLLEAEAWRTRSGTGGGRARCVGYGACFSRSPVHPQPIVRAVLLAWRRQRRPPTCCRAERAVLLQSLCPVRADGRRHAMLVGCCGAAAPASRPARYWRDRRLGGGLWIAARRRRMHPTVATLIRLEWPGKQPSTRSCRFCHTRCCSGGLRAPGGGVNRAHARARTARTCRRRIHEHARARSPMTFR